MRTRLLMWVIALAAVEPGSAAEELTAKDMSAARKIYVAKCAKCHRFYEPMSYAEADWQTWMEKMNKRSKIQGEPGSLLNRYLDAYRAGQLPGRPQDKPKSTRVVPPVRTGTEPVPHERRHVERTEKTISSGR